MELQERVTDEQRRRVAADVEAAVGDGLLELAEADERLARVWGARTAGELETARAELPGHWLEQRRRREAALSAHEQARRSLPAHLRSWLALNALLVTIWLLTSGPAGYFWPVWPALGTGICLAGHVAAARRTPAV